MVAAWRQTDADCHVLHFDCALDYEPLVVLDIVNRILDGHFGAVIILPLAASWSRATGLPVATPGCRRGSLQQKQVREVTTRRCPTGLQGKFCIVHTPGLRLFGDCQKTLEATSNTDPHRFGPHTKYEDWVSWTMFTASGYTCVLSPAPLADVLRAS